MPDEGFLRLSRRIFRSDLWREEREYSKFEAWLDLIASASFVVESTFVEGRCLSLQAGELAASVRYLASRWRWHRSKVERFMEILRKQGRIQSRVETGITIVTLSNYDVYNRCRDSNRDTDSDSRETVARQSRDKDKNLRTEEEFPSEPPALPPTRDAPSKAKAVDPRHAEIMSQWGDRFQAGNGFACTMDGGRDGSTLKRFLKSYRGTSEDFLKVADTAWLAAKGQYAKFSKGAATISGLCASFDAIRVECAKPVNGNGTAVAPRACGDLNKPGRYAGPANPPRSA